MLFFGVVTSAILDDILKSLGVILPKGSCSGLQALLIDRCGNIKGHQIVGGKFLGLQPDQIGRASCRERVSHSVAGGGGERGCGNAYNESEARGLTDDVV